MVRLLINKKGAQTMDRPTMSKITICDIHGETLRRGKCPECKIEQLEGNQEVREYVFKMRVREKYWLDD
jgi:hypothetical protein